ncbi:MAG: hypothetical protein GY888_03875 [Planctomycetaceae bacterium]|nr:hypothetical protein [Planctomycetaceae bacterium]
MIRDHAATSLFAVAAGKTDPGHVQPNSSHGGQESETDDFWQGYGLVETLV